MKQKYTILKNDEKNELIIKEFAELDKEVLSLLCEETYNVDVVRSAMIKSKESLVSTLRTQNMYPPGIYAERIADTVIELYDSENNQQFKDIMFDDIDFLTKEIIESESDELEEDSDSLEDLLEDDLEDIEDEFDNKNGIDPINSPLKIADDESLDIEDEG